MSASHETKQALESSLKATLVQLSRIVAFQARLQQQGAAQYAPPAPRHLTEQLRGEAANFEAICDALEKRALRAIAVLERDARKAAGISPLPVPSPAPAPAADSTADDDGALPFALPPSTASASTVPSASKAVQLDLTLSPSPPPAASTSAPGDDVLDAPLPFQLPPSTATSTSAPPAASAPLASDPAPIPSFDFGSGSSEDINALLASLNMPPFSVGEPEPGTAAQADTTMPDLSLDALNNLLGSTSASTSAAPPAGGSSGLDSLGLSFPSPALGATASLPTAFSAAPPAFTAVSAPPLAGAETDFSSIDFTSLGLPADFGASLSSASVPPPQPAAAAAGGGGDVDMSGLGEFDFAALMGGEAAGADAGLDELLKSLGAGGS
ncbi:uncharacterized protein JCM10292_005331 [Rhodotorula paludigena]|uniref:uncharacterized protein n=1 Tax=Rhodotorula paludigena TaxID=86838 RepID=UPI00316E904E